jgi:hypothetical protein
MDVLFPSSGAQVHELPRAHCRIPYLAKRHPQTALLNLFFLSDENAARIASIAAFA